MNKKENRHGQKHFARFITKAVENALMAGPKRGMTTAEINKAVSEEYGGIEMSDNAYRNHINTLIEGGRAHRTKNSRPYRYAAGPMPEKPQLAFEEAEWGTSAAEAMISSVKRIETKLDHLLNALGEKVE